MIEGFKIPHVKFKVREGDTAENQETCSIGHSAYRPAARKIAPNPLCQEMMPTRTRPVGVCPRTSNPRRIFPFARTSFP